MARLSGRSRGCRACRVRKIKCDEQTPECSQCTRLGKKCPGAVTGLIIFETTPENPQKFQPLGENNPKPSQAPIAAVSPNTDIVLGSGALDPFSSMAVPLDPATNVYFQHCTSRIPVSELSNWSQLCCTLLLVASRLAQRSWLYGAGRRL
jgi:hypothetical protein